MDDASAEGQLNKTMHYLKYIKHKYTQLEQHYKELETLCAKQKIRIGELEIRRNMLIKLFKEQLDRFDTQKTNLQKENSHLNASIQDQNTLINQYSATIEKLKKENASLKNKRKKPYNVIDRGIKKPNEVIHLNGNNFAHPSFDAPTADAKKKKKKSPLIFHNRYSNLDISGNGIQKEKETSENTSKIVSVKKRRLFCLEDEMIDLTIENHE